MSGFLALLFGHFIADWALQNDFVSQNKGKVWFIMLAHCMVWSGVICFLLAYMGIFTIWKFLFLLIGHWIADKYKIDNIANEDQRVDACEYNLQLLYIDQAWHVLQLIIVGLF